MNREALERPFPPDQIKHRKGNFGNTLAYLEAHTVIQRLNSALDAAWNFEVLNHQVLQDEVLVLGKLTAEGITKTQFGSSQITRKKETGEHISLGDDLKAAATDALKKAATLLGVGLHLYSEETQQQPVNGQGQPQKPGRQVQTSHPGQSSGNARHAPANGYHDPGLPREAQYQTHAHVSDQYQGQPQDQNIQTPKRLSSKQYQYLKQLASDRAMSSQELSQKTINKYGCTLDFLSSRQASELITELQKAKTAA